MLGRGGLNSVINSSSVHSSFSKYHAPVFNTQLLDRNAIALLASSSTIDVLGLIHERTGHLNHQAIIECVLKSKLVRGLEVEDKHIRKYKKEDKHVCDVCERAKLTRISFEKVHVRDRPNASGHEYTSALKKY